MKYIIVFFLAVYFHFSFGQETELKENDKDSDFGLVYFLRGKGFANLITEDILSMRLLQVSMNLKLNLLGKKVRRKPRLL